MSFQIFKPFPNNEYGDGLLLEEYNGTYYLCSSYRSLKEGASVVKRWAYPQNKDRKPVSRALPWQIRLGENREQAIQTLQFFLENLIVVNEPDTKNA